MSSDVEAAHENLDDLLAEIGAVCADAGEPIADSPDAVPCDIDELAAAVERLTERVDATMEAVHDAEEADLAATSAAIDETVQAEAAPESEPRPEEAQAAPPVEDLADAPVTHDPAAAEGRAVPPPASDEPVEIAAISGEAMLDAVACFDDPETAIEMESGGMAATESRAESDAETENASESGPEFAAVPDAHDEPDARSDALDESDAHGESDARSDGVSAPVADAPAIADADDAPVEPAAESRDLAIHDLDDELADDVETLLNANFETVSDVLDDVFEEHAALVQDQGPGPARAPVHEPAAEPDEPLPEAPVETPAPESEMLPDRPGAAAPEKEEPPEEDAEPRAFEPPEEVEATPVPPPAPIVNAEPELIVTRVSPLVVRFVKGVLREVSYPLRLLPPRTRPVLDWIALSLVFWVPIVWVVAFLIVGR